MLKRPHLFGLSVWFLSWNKAFLFPEFSHINADCDENFRRRTEAANPDSLLVLLLLSLRPPLRCIFHRNYYYFYSLRCETRIFDRLSLQPLTKSFLFFRFRLTALWASAVSMATSTSCSPLLCGWNVTLSISPHPRVPDRFPLPTRSSVSTKGAWPDRQKTEWIRLGFHRMLNESNSDISNNL